MVAAHDSSDEEIISAVLHDAVENAGHRAAAISSDIEAQFGAQVLGIVQECTDAPAGFGKGITPWRERKLAYLNGIPFKSESAILISICDKICNAKDLIVESQSETGVDWSKTSAGKDGTYWYFHSLAEAFERRSCHRIADLTVEFRSTVNHLVELLMQPR